jgi:NADPH:quinone reductase
MRASRRRRSATQGVQQARQPRLGPCTGHGLGVGVSSPRVPGIEAAGTVDAAPVGSGPGRSVLIRGGTSSVGLAAAALATWRGATVLSTTRRAGRLAVLTEHGVDHPLLDTGEVAPAVRELYPDGVDAAVDLVGTPTLPDTLRAVRVHGTACFGGSLSGQWTVRDFSPNEYLPKGVRLAGYFGDAADLPPEAFQEILDAVAADRLAFPVDRVYDGLEQVLQAHEDMEHDRAIGKLVVRVRH